MPASGGFEESAEDLYEHAPCGYLSTAPDGTIVRVNATFLRWTGYRREDVVGVKRFQDLLTVGGRIYHETHYAPLLRMQGTVREIAVDIVTADRRRLSVLVNSVLIADAEGVPQAVRTTVFDATERKSYERELVAARDRERVARERIERLQRLTAALAAAPGAAAIAAAVVGELAEAFAAARAGVAVRDDRTRTLEVLDQRGEPDPDLVTGAAWDEGGDGRGAAVRLAFGAPPSIHGRLWLGFDAARAFTPGERAFLEACVAQTGLALERSRLYETTLDVARSLQRSLLAGAPPQDARFDVATHYQPADAHLEVGGDWYDAFTLPAGSVGIVVGDVVGRGIAAASAMGQLRSAVRALAGAGFAPAALLSHLDTFVEHAEPARYATLAYAEVDPATGTVCVASAGHPPAVIVDPDGVPRLFMEGRSAPLGIETPRTQATFTLAAGAGFLLYTDGLIERRDEPIDVGLERLLATLRACSDATPAALAGALLERGIRDDVCVLSFRRRR